MTTKSITNNINLYINNLITSEELINNININSNIFEKINNEYRLSIDSAFNFSQNKIKKIAKEIKNYYL